MSTPPPRDRRCVTFALPFDIGAAGPLDPRGWPDSNRSTERQTARLFGAARAAVAVPVRSAAEERTCLHNNDRT